MSGIYIIKQKDGSHGYIGLDSRASGIESPRLKDHILHAYYLPNSFERPDKSGDIKVSVQSCEKALATNMPSSYEYGLNTNKFFGLPINKYNKFEKLGKATGKKDPRQSGAEICYIYHYRNTWANLNAAGGGQIKYVCQLAKIIDVDNLDIRPKLKRELKKNITGYPDRHIATTDNVEYMNQLFYPELQLTQLLTNYAYEQIHKVTQHLIKGKNKEGIINALQGKPFARSIEKECDQLNKECQTLFNVLLLHSTVLDPNTHCIFTANTTGMTALSSILDLRTHFKSKDTSQILINVDIDIKLIPNPKLPDGFPSDEDFSLQSFYNDTAHMKRITVEQIIPLALQAANPLLSLDYDRTKQYFDTLPTKMGITDFHSFYNHIVNFLEEQKYGPLQKEPFDDEYFKARRAGGAEDRYIIVNQQYTDILKSTRFKDITEG